jgi:hypothetical protein
MSKWNRRIAFPSVRACDPAVRKARLLAAREKPVRSRPRWAIMMGHWDGGDVLAKHGLPVTYDPSWKNKPCEALAKEGDSA